MFLKLLLLIFFVSYCETVTKPVRGIKGIKGRSVILPCELQDRDISLIVLSRFSRITLLCENEECKSTNVRVFKEGSCDVVIKDLIFRDAGKYILTVYYINNQEELEPQTSEYQLHIQDEISVGTGDELKLDVLLIIADKVEHQSRISTEWKEVWTKGHGVISDRLTVSDESLIIKEFKVTDAGTYRVLDFNKILITVTVTESGSAKEHKDSLHPPPEPSSSSKTQSVFFVNWGFIMIIIVCSVCFVARMRPRAVRTGLGFLFFKLHKSFSIFYRIWLSWRTER